ncbi:MAG TPA: ABC transporter substrate-binding protein, partial [Clostridia bacterium]|nr:ABC transporter substrate-binding protein [Clostridia bacterium]
LAKISVSPDGLTYTFTLQGARYSDGVAVGAEDFVNTLYWMLMPTYEGSRDIRSLDIAGVSDYLDGLAQTIAGIAVLSSQSFSVTLNAPNPSAPAFLSLPAMRVAHFGSAIRPENTPDDPEIRALFYQDRMAEMRAVDPTLASYGQYDLETYEDGARARFAANADYWRGRPSTPYMELLTVPVGREYEAVTSGDVDIIHCYPSVAIVDDAYEAGYLNMYTWTGDVFGYIGMRTDQPPFSDARVRQAMAYALRRRIIQQLTLESYMSIPGIVLFDAFPPNSNEIMGDAENPGELYSLNSEKAEDLLDEAGWIKGEDGLRSREGERFAFTLYLPEENPVSDVLESEMKLCCEWLGLTMTVERLPYLDLAERVEKNGCDMYLQARRIPADPAVAADLFVGDSHLNASGYDSEGVERFLRWAAKESNPESQAVVYEGLYQQIYLELPFIPLYRRSELMLANGRVRNMYVSSGHDVLAEAYRLIIRDSLGDEE